ncbi:integrase arm-type DNA-binding domain-containing protein [Caulobacter endophyticus]|uniref:integrase arm-type DNA-binding domain-containing protein n=1 Tax=Caulobacter endophyticus TaxID=2172652 RepID=UPI00240F2C1F|nr:integrase arm-type DNA-binding domain-containing protein [Caulobacter endophyticus]MDG2531283.1 integrase arm-type DNA-binding domain-containing protein [Caulobacter endophyticus]
MASLQLLLTDKAVARLPYAEAGQYVVRDSELAGFLLKVGKRRKTFMAEGEHWKHGVREFRAQTKLGEFGELTSRDARGKAKDVLGQIARGERPGGEARPKAQAITLRGAWQNYLDRHLVRKGRDAGTIANYRDHVERLLADWLDLPLARLGETPTLVVERHERLSELNGPYIANGAMRSLRAIYNHALKTNPDLPGVNPVKAIDWNVEVRRDTGMGDQDLGGWLRQAFALESPIRREYHLLVLLSGSRPTALKKVRIEHIDLRRRILHIPRPKGGPKKAFDIPLSRAMVRCVVRAMRWGRLLYPEQAETWLFPADSAAGHLVEHKEKRSVLSKWGNDLRQTFRTIAQVAEVSELDAHLLMNHSLPGVNTGYITRDRLLSGHLRRQQERISRVVCQRAASAEADIKCWISGAAKLTVQASLVSAAPEQWSAAA